MIHSLFYKVLGLSVGFFLMWGEMVIANMAHDGDNVDASGAGETFASDLIQEVHYKRTKITLGADGSNDGDLSLSNPMPTAEQLQIPRLNVVQAFTVNGDGSGNANIDGDFSSVADDFFIQPTVIVRILSIDITLALIGNNAFTILGYGNENVPLTNGVKLIESYNGVERIITTIKSNLGWENSARNTSSGNAGQGGAAAEFLSFFIEFPQTIRLDPSGTPDKLILRVNDDHTQFSGGVQVAVAEGFIE